MPKEPTYEELHGAFGVESNPEEPSAEELSAAFQPEPKESWGDWAKKEAAGLATGVGKVVPFGQDIPAAIGATLAGAGLMPGSKNVPEEGTWGERFDAAKRAQMAVAEKMGKETPGAQMAGEALGIAGTIPLMEVAAPAELAVASKVAPKIGQTAADILATTGTGTAFGAAQGLGEGVSLEDRLSNAETGALIGGGLGAGLSTAGKGIKALTKPAVLTPAEEAAQRLNIEMPWYLGTEHPFPKKLATFSATMPVGGGQIQKSAKTAREGLEAAIDTVTGYKPSEYEAGSSAKQGIQDWIKPRSSATVSKAYDYVDKYVNPKIRTPLANVKSTLNNVRSLNYLAGQGDASFASLVEEALNRKTGLSYEGIKRLRTIVGEKLDNPSLLPAGTSATEYKNLYAALSEDLKTAAQRAGGPKGLRAFERANSLNARVQAKRQELAKIIGENADVAPELIFARISNMAKGSGRGNLDRLKMARKSMPPAAWEDVTSGVIGTLGRNRAGEFSPTTFITQYSSIPNESKNIIFGPAGNPVRQSLDDILSVSKKFGEMNEYSNPSGTAKVLAGLELLMHPTGMIGGPAAAKFFSTILARPRTAKAAARVQNAYVQDLQKAIDPSSARSATQIALRDFMTSLGATESMVAAEDREQHASGGTVGLSRMEKAVARAQKAIAEETKPLMEMPDQTIAHALEIAKDK
jgi:hypothetical protein